MHHVSIVTMETSAVYKSDCCNMHHMLLACKQPCIIDLLMQFCMKEGPVQLIVQPMCTIEKTILVKDVISKVLDGNVTLKNQSH